MTEVEQIARIAGEYHGKDPNEIAEQVYAEVVKPRVEERDRLREAIDRAGLTITSQGIGCAVPATDTLQAIAEMMSEFVENWPYPKKIETAIVLIAKTIRPLVERETVLRELVWLYVDPFDVKPEHRALVNSIGKPDSAALAQEPQR